MISIVSFVFNPRKKILYQLGAQIWTHLLQSKRVRKLFVAKLWSFVIFQIVWSVIFLKTRSRSFTCMEISSKIPVKILKIKFGSTFEKTIWAKLKFIACEILEIIYFCSIQRGLDKDWNNSGSTMRQPWNGKLPTQVCSVVCREYAVNILCWYVYFLVSYFLFCNTNLVDHCTVKPVTHLRTTGKPNSSH